MVSGEELWNTFDRIDEIMCETSTNCLHPEIPYGSTLYCLKISFQFDA